MHNALEYVQGKLNMAEQVAFFDHVRTCQECQQDLILFFQLKKLTAPVQAPPQVVLPKQENAIVQALKQTRSVLALGFKLLPLGE